MTSWKQRAFQLMCETELAPGELEGLLLQSSYPPEESDHPFAKTLGELAKNIAGNHEATAHMIDWERFYRLLEVRREPLRCLLCDHSASTLSEREGHIEGLFVSALLPICEDCKKRESDLEEHRRLLLWKQKRLEAELTKPIDRRQRDGLEAEYSDVVSELERMDAGTWTAPE